MGERARIRKEGKDWIVFVHGMRIACNTFQYALSQLRIELENPELSMGKFVNPRWFFARWPESWPTTAYERQRSLRRLG